MAKSDEAKYEITRRKRLARIGRRRVATLRLLFYASIVLFLVAFIMFFVLVSTSLPSATKSLLVFGPLFVGFLFFAIAWFIGISPVVKYHWGLWWGKETPLGKRRESHILGYYQILSVVPFLAAFLLQANIYITSLAAIFFFVLFGYATYRGLKLHGSPFSK